MALSFIQHFVRLEYGYFFGLSLYLGLLCGVLDSVLLLTKFRPLMSQLLKAETVYSALYYKGVVVVGTFVAFVIEELLLTFTRERQYTFEWPTRLGFVQYLLPSCIQLVSFISSFLLIVYFRYPCIPIYYSVLIYVAFILLHLYSSLLYLLSQTLSFILAIFT